MAEFAVDIAWEAFKAAAGKAATSAATNNLFRFDNIYSKLVDDLEIYHPYFKGIFHNIDQTAPREWEKDALRFKETLEKGTQLLDQHHSQLQQLRGASGIFHPQERQRLGNEIQRLTEEIQKFTKDNRLPILGNLQVMERIRELEERLVAKTDEQKNAIIEEMISRLTVSNSDEAGSGSNSIARPRPSTSNAPPSPNPPSSSGADDAYDIYELKDLTVKELKDATQSFHSSSIIGSGRSAIVYKGRLRMRNEEVAIKVMDKKKEKAFETKENFEYEADIIFNIKDPNVIQLLGFMADNSRWYLVYEYLPNRSLGRHIYGGLSDEALELNWKARFEIICGIAKGLCHLHEKSHVRFVHGDISPNQILLDNNLEPKISDLIGTRYVSIGHMAPEYERDRKISKKTDVYSFGVTTMEIVSGRRAVDEHTRQHIVEWVWELYKEMMHVDSEKRGSADPWEVQTVDSKIRGSTDRWEAKNVVHVALLCTQTNPEARPFMSEACRMLSNIESKIPDLPVNVSSSRESLSSSSSTPYYPRELIIKTPLLNRYL